MKKNFDKKLTTKELEKFVNKQEQVDSKSGRENIIMWSVLILGTVGLGIVLSSNTLFRNEKNESISSQKISSDQGLIARAEVATLSSRRTEKTQGNLVQIKGIREASEVIVFEVDGYQKNANYKFDFGDGTTRTMNTSRIKYAYRKPGKYKVQLKGTYNKETKVLYKNSITISEPIEVADGALKDMQK